MSKVLAGFLDQPEVLVESAIRKLEHLNGWESTDVRLLAEVNYKVRTKLAKLGLDPDDTTGPELYQALLAKLSKDEEYLNINSQDLIAKVMAAHSMHKVYALKDSVAKELLRKHPPRKLMKHLGYRSIDSMIKRENIAELFGGLQLVELSRWTNVFWRDLAKLKPSDFEVQSIKAVTMPEGRWEHLRDQHVATSLPLLGVVLIWSIPSSRISLSLGVANNINDLVGTSALIKLRNVEHDFGKSLVDIIQKRSDEPLKLSHMPISWRTIFHHYGSRDAREHTEFFGPHLLHEDIKAHNPIKVLSSVSPIFNWWQDLEYVAKKTEEGIVSFNLSDVAEDRTKEFKDRSLSHFRGSLWHEFINRYLMHPSVEQHFMGQLEPQTVPVEDLQPYLEPERDIRQMIEAGV